MKLAVIGGGSTYTPELVDGVARLSDDIKVEELVLVDPDETRLSVVGPVSSRIMRTYGHPAQLAWTTNLDEGLDGAGAVLLQLRVGGQAARQRDETWPLEYGCIGQETTGAGGFAKALRTVPVVLDIALLDAGHRALGLCNVAIGFQRHFAALVGADPSQVLLDHVGLNHLTWERAAIVDGVDVLPGLIEAHGDEVAEHTGLPVSVLQDLSAVPSYYLHYFYEHDAVVERQRHEPTRAEEVARLERELLVAYADPALDHKPEMLSQRGGAFYSEAAVALLASLVGDAGDVQVVNLRNQGTMPFLPDEAVIEVPAAIGAAGAVAVPVAPLPPLMAGLVGHVSAYEELALDAALRGGRKRVADALLAHPLVGQYELAGQLADRLIAENAQYLSWAQ